MPQSLKLDHDDHLSSKRTFDAVILPDTLRITAIHRLWEISRCRSTVGRQRYETYVSVTKSTGYSMESLKMQPFLYARQRDALIEPGRLSATRVSGRQQMLHRPANMSPDNRFFVKNTLLASLSLQDLAALGSLLEPIVLRERMVLQEPKKHLHHVYFIESGLVSLRIVAEGSILETAVIGFRGAVGASVLLGGNLPTHQSVVLLPGRAHRISVDDLHRIMNERPDLREHLVRYLQALTLHSAQAGLCGVRHNREKRLASWLCLASDAIDANVLPVTHEYLSSALGLRRAGVTETLIRFEEQGLIRKMRGVLHIDERKCLEQKACCCFKLISGAYASAAGAEERGCS